MGAEGTCKGRFSISFALRGVQEADLLVHRKERTFVSPFLIIPHVAFLCFLSSKKMACVRSVFSADVADLFFDDSPLLGQRVESKEWFANNAKLKEARPESHVSHACLRHVS